MLPDLINGFHLDISQLVKYIIEDTKIEVNTRNKKGSAAVDLLDNDDENFHQLSTVLMCDPKILIEHPSSHREMGSFEVQVVDDLKKLQKEMLRVQSRDSPKKPFEMQLEALQSARNTLTIVGVLIASVTFTCGINPPGRIYQEGLSIGKSTGKNLSFRDLLYKQYHSVAYISVYGHSSPQHYTLREDSLLKFLVIAHWMMWVAVSAMASAYVSAASVTLPHCGETKWLLCATLAIASLTLGGMFVYLRFKLAKCVLRKVKLLRCLSSPPVRKNGSVDMAANIVKGYYSY